jgi:hypothetical protein
LLVEKVFPAQAAVVTVEEFLAGQRERLPHISSIPHSFGKTTRIELARQLR